MLRGIAVFSMKGRWFAILTISLLSLAALKLLPPLVFLASGVIALVTLRMGPKEGAKIVAGTVLVVTLLVSLLLKQPYLSIVLLVLAWLPVFGVSLILGYTRSLAVSLCAIAGLGILLVLGLHLVLPSPALWWQEVITSLMATLAEQIATLPESSNVQFEQPAESDIIYLSTLMTSILALWVSLNMILGLLIGRSWQAKLYNPGGFASEFQQLRLGRPVAVLAIITMMLAMSPVGESLLVLKDCLPVMFVLFVLQALSVIHMIVKQQKMNKFWLVLIYILLLVPQVMILLAMVGVLEQWFNFRQRLIKRGE